jgi:hypothetical protein
LQTGDFVLSKANWIWLCAELRYKGKYVKLDLSACTAGGSSGGSDYGLRADNTFDGRVSNMHYGPAVPWPDLPWEIAGIGKITELILPDAAIAIAAGQSFTAFAGGGLGNVVSLFSRYLALTKLTGRNITVLGNNAFTFLAAPSTQRASLTEIILPKAVTVGNNAFSSLQNCAITLSKGLSSLGTYVFYGAQDLTFTLDGTGSAEVFGGGKVLLTTGGALAVIASTEAYELDLSSTSLTGAALGTVFQNNASVSGVSLPATVTTINANAFSGCSSLQSITLSAPLTSVGTNAFQNCHANLAFSGSVENGVILEGKVLITGTAPNKALGWVSPGFSGNLDLSAVNGLTSLAAIGTSAQPNTAITGIVVPNGVTALPANFVRYCPNL